MAANIQKQWPNVEVLALQLDVRKGEEVKAVLAQIVAQFGRLDVAINNAGVVGKSAQIHELDESDWETVLSVNLHGVHRCQKEELGIMVKQEYVQTWTRLPSFTDDTRRFSPTIEISVHDEGEALSSTYHPCTAPLGRCRPSMS